MITPKTRLIALLGYPVEHSLSPAMHNAAFAALELDMAYLAFSVPPSDLQQAVHGIKALGMVGANVTAPHKEAVIPFLERVSPRAASLGAVNTIINNNGKLEGENTDWKGCYQALQELLPSGAGGIKALILGSGGAARAAGLALALAGADRLIAANRTRERALRLAEITAAAGLQADVIPMEPALLKQAVAESDLIVTALPFDLTGEGWQWLYTPGTLKGKYLFDLRYAPGGTPLVRKATAMGARGADGKAMLLYQGAEAFTLFTGLPAPLQVMRGAIAN